MFEFNDMQTNIEIMGIISQHVFTYFQHASALYDFSKQFLTRTFDCIVKKDTESL